MNTPTTAASDFGSNQWLVEEMYEQYKSDKNSVDKSWWPVFEKFEAEGGASANGARTAPSSGKGESASSAKAAPAKTSAPAKTAPAKAAPAKQPSEPAPAADKDTTTDRGVNPSTADEETVKAESKSAGAENCRSAAAPSRKTSRMSSRSSAAPPS